MKKIKKNKKKCKKVLTTKSIFGILLMRLEKEARKQKKKEKMFFEN